MSLCAAGENETQTEKGVLKRAAPDIADVFLRVKRGRKNY